MRTVDALTRNIRISDALLKNDSILKLRKSFNSEGGLVKANL